MAITFDDELRELLHRIATIAQKQPYDVPNDMLWKIQRLQEIHAVMLMSIDRINGFAKDGK